MSWLAMLCHAFSRSAADAHVRTAAGRFVLKSYAVEPVCPRALSPLRLGGRRCRRRSGGRQGSAVGAGPDVDAGPAVGAGPAVSAGPAVDMTRLSAPASRSAADNDLGGIPRRASTVEVAPRRSRARARIGALSRLMH
ncbi:hypothetical protein FPZ11_10400 [Humibacter ginsenosidimutans]|uniref:Uncharacterized protein n=1 Tax=Humibacter ginsenosidimutans TaxID=2599293 RepID=A0A5B8M490_9MICO|nr:hypothetical protein FPZ11_10400 [Humibacter ginsenosidimutans]